jgi:hypothetical protein
MLELVPCNTFLWNIPELKLFDTSGVLLLALSAKILDGKALSSPVDKDSMLPVIEVLFVVILFNEK